jgi:hypothetical protein
MTGTRGRNINEVNTFCRRCARVSEEYHKENTITYGCNHVLGRLFPAIQPNSDLLCRFLIIYCIASSDEYQDWLKLEE